MQYRKRQARARQRMERGGVEALLISHLPNVRYLCGFSGSNALLLLAPTQTILFTDGRYREQARTEVTGASVVVPPKGDLWKAAAAKAAKLKRVGLDSDHVTVTQRSRWLASWSGRAAGLKSASGWIEPLRAVKDPEEIEAIERAVRLASSAFAPTLKRCRPGVSETELAGWLEFNLRRAGGEGLAFETILAGGAHGALVHAQPGRQPLPHRGRRQLGGARNASGRTLPGFEARAPSDQRERPGQKVASHFVVMDYGVVLAGYHSDMTRTVHLGRPDRKAQTVYRAVLEAQLAAIAAVRPGVTGATVDAAARSVLRQAGFARYFPHSTGHGVGLEIHEAPRIASTATGENDRLQTGQVVTIEPGVYIPGWGGVRIEDVVLVTAQGAKVLTPTPKDLIVL